MKRTLTVLAIVAAACSSSSSSSSTSSPPTSTASGSITVFAAASLTGAFKASNTPGLTVTYNFAGSSTLVSQIEQGAPADVFASADAKNMQKLVDAGLVFSPSTFARNKLEIAVAPGNPKHIAGLADLARSDVSVVLEAVGVPAGDYTRMSLARRRIDVTPKSLETDVKSALAKVTSGEADATVVYVTDVRAAGASVAGVDIASPDQPPNIDYSIAVLKASKNQAAANAFVDSAVSGDVQRALDAAGFLPSNVVP